MIGCVMRGCVSEISHGAIGLSSVSNDTCIGRRRVCYDRVHVLVDHVLLRCANSGYVSREGV